jgi:signal recognition particle receptor subunit beta
MVLFNAATKELTAKIVYYGPGLCGKTTNLKHLYNNLPGNERGKLLSLNTDTDQTLFFDFLPISLGNILSVKTRIQLYTVPGQVYYNETRKMVLRGADAVVFVADSQSQMLESNKESFQNLIDNLAEQGVVLSKTPHVIQWNKRDLASAMPIDVLDREINRYGTQTFEACAITGMGVYETLMGISNLALKSLSEKYGGGSENPLELGAGQELDAESDAGQMTEAASIEIPLVLERKQFDGPGPFEIKVKLFLK